MGKAAARRSLPQAPLPHRVIHPPRLDCWIASASALGVVDQVVERFAGVAVMAGAAKPFVDAPVGAAPLAGAAAPQHEQQEHEQPARRFPGVARMADLAKPLVPLADVPVGAAVPEGAQAALRLPGVAGVVELANLFVAA